MPIAKKPAAPAAPAAQPSALDEAKTLAFIQAAPDGGMQQAEPERAAKSRKETISLGIEREIIDRMDARAAKIGQSRAGAIRLACLQFLERGAVIDGE